MRNNTIRILVAGLALALSIWGSLNAPGQSVVKQGPPVPDKFCIDANELELYRMINAYRRQFSLPPIPLSKSLSYVADLHTKDLYLHHPDQGSCNFHSWSNKGTWLPFCYPKDENKKNSVWDKPHELTKYPGKAYEIVYWENNPLVKDTIFMVWKMEDYFNSFLLNSGKWQGKTWNAIGIAVYENYACAWFGEMGDPEGDAIVCGKSPDTTPLLPVVQNANSKSSTPKPVDSISGIYYIIVKTNLPRDQAEKLVLSLKDSGYPSAGVYEKDGKIRVSAFESPDKALSMAKLKDIKKIYKDAWVLKR